jgi:hypothetical protein
VQRITRRLLRRPELSLGGRRCRPAFRLFMSRCRRQVRGVNTRSVHREVFVRVTGGEHLQPARGDVALREGVLLGLWIYEGALSFVTGICCIYRDSPYKRKWEGE